MMSKDEEDYFKHNIGVESERELDNLADIRSNLDTSQSTITSPTHQRLGVMFSKNFHPGMSDPPHRSRPRGRDEDQRNPSSPRSPRSAGLGDTAEGDNAASLSGTGTYSVRQEDTDEEITSQTTPVKKLKKSVKLREEVQNDPPPRVERELSDAYIDSLSRTPRYNTHADYSEMAQNLAEGDPFSGEYVPSGKDKKAKKHRKHKHKSEIPVPLDSVKSDSAVLSNRRRSKKKKNHTDSRDSAATYTVSGHSNPSYTFNESSRDQIDQHEETSMNSNGTYTLQREDSSTALVNDKGKSPTKSTIDRTKSVHSISLKSKSSRRKSKLGIDKDALQKYIRQSQLKQRKPLTASSQQGMSRFSKPQTIWHPHTHTEKVASDSYGEIQFHGYGHDTDSSPYIRVSNDTKPDVIMNILLQHWKLPKPKLLISVTGGAKRFDLKPKLLGKFKRGLISAATSTDAWIITGGTKTGVMEMVGMGVREHAITSGKHGDIVALGVTTWGSVANRSALSGERMEEKTGLFPAVYSKQGVDSEQSSKTVPLDHNHTHFILVDDGSVEKFGGEIEFRANLERYISHILCGDSNGRSQGVQVNIPVIQIIIEGGIGSMKTVYESVRNGIPVLVLDGTGRAADFIAEGYHRTKDAQNEDKSFFPKDFREKMEELASEGFEWKAGEKDKPAKIATCLQQLEESLRERKMLSVVDLNQTDNREFDKAILNALLKANKSDGAAQLSLALAWNRSDIAQNEIFTDRRKITADMKLNDAMMTALIQDRTDFVKLFMDNGVELRDFLNTNNLWNLYANCLKDKKDSSAQLLNNHIMYLKQTWGAYLCCRPVENMGNQPDLLMLVGKSIVHLLGDEGLNPYQDENFEVGDHVEPLLGYISDGEANTSNNSSKINTKKYDFEYPEKDLFIWALLMNRTTLAMLFWKIGRDHLGAALLAASLLKALSKLADDEEEIELSLSLLEHSEVFEKVAVDVLTHCYKQNKFLSHQLLVRQLKNYGNTTLMLLADENTLMEFLDHTCCQTKLNNIWKGRMALYTSTFKIIASMFVPFLIPAIKFTSNKNPAEHLDDDEEEDFDDLMEGENCESLGNTNPGGTNKVNPEVTEKRSKKFLKKKLYKVQFLGMEENSISVLKALYYFYTAPVTKFWFYTFSYLAYLGLFSYFVLTNLHPVSSPNSPGGIEIVTWGWTITMVVDEVRQVVTRDQRSMTYKIKSWYGNIWNRFDLIMYILFILSVILRFSLSESNFQWARITYSITLSMYFLRFMQSFFVEKNIGPKVIMIRRMLTDLLFFFAILAVFVVSFGTAYQANLFPNATPSWDLLKQVVYLPYWQMYGELFLENMEGTEPATCSSNRTEWESGSITRCAERSVLVPLLLAVYMILTNILLVNLLIAMFSDTFQKVQDNSLKVWRFFKFSLVYEYYERPTFFPPLILFNHIFRVIRWIIHKTCRTMNYHDDFKLKLNEKDDFQLTLFEREAVEEHLHAKKKFEREQLSSKVSNTAERLERVMEELDSIKESVIKDKTTRNKTGDTEVVPLTSRTSRSSNLGPSIQDQMNQLSSYVREEMQSMASTVERLEELLQSKILVEAVKKSTTAPSLDITHVHSTGTET